MITLQRTLGVMLAVLAGFCLTIERAAATQESTPAHVDSVKAAFKQPIKLKRRFGNKVEVFPGDAPVVRIGEDELFAVPLAISKPNGYTLTVKSTVTLLKDGTRVLFYPVVSFVDDEFRIFRTIQPKSEFDFDNAMDTLTSEFEVPADVKRVLIHTETERIHSSFVGIASGQKDRNAAMGFGWFVGGIVGIAAAAGATSSSSGKEFRFGPVGLIFVEMKSHR